MDFGMHVLAELSMPRVGNDDHCKAPRAARYCFEFVRILMLRPWPSYQALLHFQHCLL